MSDSEIDLDSTDELPVLSEEAIMAARSAAEANALAESIDSLRALVNRAERRWDVLETTLRSQDEAIADLKTALEAVPARSPAAQAPNEHTDPPSTGAGPAAEPDAAAETRQDAPSTETAAAQDERGIDPVDERRLLERIASLEAYIAGRADRWKAMEHELERQSARIAELESELAQRVEREERLVERLHSESSRSETLREKLRLLNRQLEASRLDHGRRDHERTRRLDESAAHGETSSASRADGVPTLTCLTSEATERFVITRALVRIGRGPDCDIRINRDFVSREHAILRYEHPEAIIEDRASTNGVFVNDQRVQRKRLAHGDEIRIGETRFRFSASALEE